MKNLLIFGVGLVSAAVLQQNPHDLDRLPAQEGEIAAVDNSIQFLNETLEVEGICKLTEDSAVCWRPDGTAFDSLSSELTNAIQRLTSDYRTYSVSFGKKRRVLVLKDTTYPSQVYQPRSSNPYIRSDNTGKFQEGWSSSSNSFRSSSANGFDGSNVNRHVYDGVFEKSTSNYPFRYSISTYGSSPTIVPLKLGQFEIDGNVLEIVSIKDHPKPVGNDNGPRFYSGPYLQPKHHDFRTDIQFKVISIKRPFTTSSIGPMDADGHYIPNADDNGKPISEATVNAWNKIHRDPKKPAEEMPYPYSGSAYFDPMLQKEGSTFMMSLFLSKESFQKLSFSLTRREVYVFEKIALDPK